MKEASAHDASTFELLFVTSRPPSSQLSLLNRRICRWVGGWVNWVIMGHSKHWDWAEEMKRAALMATQQSYNQQPVIFFHSPYLMNSSSSQLEPIKGNNGTIFCTTAGKQHASVNFRVYKRLKTRCLENFFVLQKAAFMVHSLPMLSKNLQAWMLEFACQLFCSRYAIWEFTITILFNQYFLTKNRTLLKTVVGVHLQ